MKQLTSYLYLIQKINFAQKFNFFLYYFKMIPWLGKKIPDAFYHSPKIKVVMSVIIFIFTMLCSFVSKLGYILLMIILPANLILAYGNDMRGGILFLFLIISGFAGPLFMNTTVTPAKKEFTMIRLMHMDSKRYVLAQWLMNYGMKSLWMLLAFILCFVKFDIPIWYSFVLIVYYTGSHFLGERIQIQYCVKYNKTLVTNYVLMAIALIVLVGGAYAGLFVLRDQINEFIIVLIITMIVLGVGMFATAIPYLRKVDYPNLMQEGITRQMQYIQGTAVKEAQRKDVELKDKDYDQEELKTLKFKDKKGYEYLNAMFFQRHKRLFYRPMRRRIIGIIIVIIVMDIAGFFFGKELFANMGSLLKFLPPTLFLMYFLSIGERVTRAMFYNCDASLLRYGYYRQPKAILTNFKIRLRKIALMNVCIAILLCLGIASFTLILQVSTTLVEQLLFSLGIICISIFFSVHHLFLYYVLQPYTGELEMKSPMFVLLNSAVYLMCYGGSQIQGGLGFVIIIIAATLSYSIIALILVYKLSYKTFHIR